MANDTAGPMDFEALYGDAQSSNRLIPWDIGGPQPVVAQLVACGAVRGEVLDPGTGPGYHAIHYASHGLSATGIDGSPSAIEQARRNAERAGVQVDFQVADATTLQGFEDRFDTVVDSAFYHVFSLGGDGGEATQTRYVQALHRATRPGARLFMFEFGCHNVNGLRWPGIPADNFDRVLAAGGWRLDHLGQSTYVCQFGPATIAQMATFAEAAPAQAELLTELQHRLRILAPLLDNDRVHMPVWAVAASRLD